MTAGMVQHYFRTKDEMMVFALGACRARVQARLAAADLSGVRDRGGLRALLAQLLPLDDERTLEAHVGLAFQAYAAVQPEIAAELRTETAEMRTAVAVALTGRRPPPPSVDPIAAATGLLALVEGLSLQVLGRHLDPQQAITALEAQLDLVLGPAGTL